MELLLLLMILGGLGYLGYRYLKTNKPELLGEKPKAKESTSARPAYASKLGDKQTETPLWELKSGDMVKFDGTDFFVQYARYCDDRGYKWTEFLLDDRLGSKLWLSVEDDNGIDLGIWKEARLADITGKVGDQTVSYDGAVYKLRESGSATYSTPDRNERGRFEHFQYETDTKEMLSFQCSDSINWDVSDGRRCSPLDFDIYVNNQQEGK